MITLYRAADNDYAGSGACYGDERSASAYLAQPDLGLGGDKLYRVALAPGSRVLDIQDEGDPNAVWGLGGDYGWQEPITIGDETKTVREWMDMPDSISTYRLVEDHRSAFAAAGWTHVALTDDWPESGLCVQRVADGSDTLTEDPEAAADLMDYREIW